MDRIGVVVIGRNEGERLRKCFESIRGKAHIVYVDSGSSDGSVELASSFGINVIKLDLSRPFTAARARNEGFARICEVYPTVEYVQFVDGDCEMFDQWLRCAVDFLDGQSEFALVCGRLKEKFPEKSLYNRLCNIEWNGAFGEILSCGGIFMIKSRVYHDIGGMNPAIVAGEEPEMCLRIRMKGYKLYRLDEDMGWHDANILHLKQWYKRTMRTGVSYATGRELHGNTEFRHFVREKRSSLVWGIALPSSILLGLIFLGWPVLFLFLAYPAMVIRIHRKSNESIVSRSDRLLYSFNCIASKFPQAMGILMYHKNKLLGKENRIIEHK